MDRQMVSSDEILFKARLRGLYRLYLNDNLKEKLNFEQWLKNNKYL